MLTQEFKINYEFFPPPKTLKKKMRFAHLTCNEYKMMDLISDTMAEWPDTRQNFEKELSGSYLAKNIDLCESAIYRAISGLISKGFIAVVSEAKKGVGRVLKILTDDLQFSHIKTANNKETLSVQETTNMSVVSSQNNDQQDKNEIPEETPKTEPLPRTIVSEEKLSENLPEAAASAEVLPQCQASEETTEIKPSFLAAEKKEESSENLLQAAAPAGVLSHCLRNGIKILRKRGIVDLAEAVRRIGEEMKVRVIKNVNGYFTELCKTMDLASSAGFLTQDSPAAVSQANQSPVTQGSNTAAVAEAAQRENDRKFKEEEKEQGKNPMEVLREYEEKYPVEMEEIRKNTRIPNNMNTEIIRAVIYVEKFKELYGSS